MEEKTIQEPVLTPRWVPSHEPLYITLLRNGTIAVVVGGVFAKAWGGLAFWPSATLLALWPSLGGHWVELWFLNWLRPRLPEARVVQVAARLAVWFVGGCVLAVGAVLTAKLLMPVRPMHWASLRLPGLWVPELWVAGPGFIGIELIAHLALQLRGRPSFYNGRG